MLPMVLRCRLSSSILGPARLATTAGPTTKGSSLQVLQGGAHRLERGRKMTNWMKRNEVGDLEVVYAELKSLNFRVVVGWWGITTFTDAYGRWAAWLGLSLQCWQPSFRVRIRKETITWVVQFFFHTSGHWSR